MKKFILALISIFIASLIPVFLQPASGGMPASLEEGVEQYKEENYEEAIDILMQVRKRDPNSATAAFFLGMAYKQVIDYPKAAIHLEASAILAPKLREAVVELIDVFYQMGKLDKAKHWINGGGA